jgi:hypothetical protein
MIESLLIFSVSKYDFAIDLQYSPLILRTDKVLKKTLDGYESLDSKIFPIQEINLINLKELLDLGKTEISQNSRILVFEINEIRLGMIVDEVKYVMSIDEDAYDIKNDELGDKANAYHTVKSNNKNINFINIEEILSLSELSHKEKNFVEDKINIATIEDADNVKDSTDLVAISIGIKEPGNPFIIAVNREGNLNQL